MVELVYTTGLKPVAYYELVGSSPIRSISLAKGQLDPFRTRRDQLRN